MCSPSPPRVTLTAGARYDHYRFRATDRKLDDGDPAWLVVGVASDAMVRTLGEAPRNMVYLPYSQRFSR